MLWKNPGSDSSLQESEIEARAFVELIRHVENGLKWYILFQVFCIAGTVSKLPSGLGLKKENNKVRFKE